VSKKLQEKQRRRLAEQMRREQQRKAARRSNLITIGIAVLIIGTVTFFVISERAQDEDVPEAPAGSAAQEAGCDEIAEHEEEGSDHVPDNTDVEYETSPPTSGSHWQTPADPSFYPTEVPEETLVHNLEHGQIVIWYRPDAAQRTIDDIEGLIESANDPDQPSLQGGAPGPLLAAPYSDIDQSKSFVMTAWGASQACARYSLEVINDFRTKYQGRGPEQIAPPFNG
jgi:Protein of unknown function (DUF3105)